MRRDADPIPLLEQLDLHLARLDRRKNRGEHDDAGNEVDEKIPLPPDAVRQQAADVRPDGRSQRRGDPEHGLADALEVLGHLRDDDRQRGRDEHAARESLPGAEDDHLAQARGNAAHRGEEKKKHHVASR